MNFTFFSDGVRQSSIVSNWFPNVRDQWYPGIASTRLKGILEKEDWTLSKGGFTVSFEIIQLFIFILFILSKHIGSLAARALIAYYSIQSTPHLNIGGEWLSGIVSIIVILWGPTFNFTCEVVILLLRMNGNFWSSPHPAYIIHRWHNPSVWIPIKTSKRWRVFQCEKLITLFHHR